MYRYRAHPWHGIDLGPNVPQEVRTFIEIVPTDTVNMKLIKSQVIYL